MGCLLSVVFVPIRLFFTFIALFTPLFILEGIAGFLVYAGAEEMFHLIMPHWFQRRCQNIRQRRDDPSIAPEPIQPTQVGPFHRMAARMQDRRAQQGDG